MAVPRHRPLPPISHFYGRLLRNLGMAAVIVSGSLTLGAVGYHSFEGTNWIDSFYAGAMILTTMGPTSPLTHDSAKVFAIFYALFSGMVFITVMSLILGPVVHRFLHRFHLETQAGPDKPGE